MYIETVPNRSSRPAILLCEGQRVRKRTLANLTHWPTEKVEALRQVLEGQRLLAPDDAFAIERSLPHGHVEAVLAMARRLELDRLIAPKRCPERDRVLAIPQTPRPCLSRSRSFRSGSGSNISCWSGIGGC